MPKPLCIDLFCGLGGWTEGFLAEGWDVIGFDIKRHVYGDQRSAQIAKIPFLLSSHIARHLKPPAQPATR
jgi:hypothetical protein